MLRPAGFLQLPLPASRTSDELTYTVADLETGTTTVTYLDAADTEQTDTTNYHSYDTGTDVLTVGHATLPSRIVSIITETLTGFVNAVFQNSNKVPH